MTGNSRQPIYRRMLVKLSGEMLQGEREFGIEPRVLQRVTAELTQLINHGVEVAVVIGGGNFCRGNTIEGVDRLTGDHMGMLATIMNGLAIADALKKAGQKASVFSALPIDGIVEAFNPERAKEALTKKCITIFVGGTGNPFFTTDTAASLRAIEISADILVKATKVDGVYNADPVKNPDATRFERLHMDEVLSKQLQVMDLSAICLCKDHHLPIRVFNFNHDNALYRIALGDNEGTFIAAGDKA